MYVTTVNILRSNSPLRLFIGLCLKKTKPSSVGCAIELCAPLTDWNIPHRGLASLPSAGQLSLCTTKKHLFFYFFLFFTIVLCSLNCENGYFVNLQDNLISFYMLRYMLGCQFHLVSQTSTLFLLLYGHFFSYPFCRSIRGTWERFYGSVCGIRQPGTLLCQLVLSSLVCSAFYSDGLFTESYQVSYVLLFLLLLLLLSMGTLAYSVFFPPIGGRLLFLFFLKWRFFFLALKYLHVYYY